MTPIVNNMHLEKIFNVYYYDSVLRGNWSFVIIFRRCWLLFTGRCQLMLWVLSLVIVIDNKGHDKMLDRASVF